MVNYKQHYYRDITKSPLLEVAELENREIFVLYFAHRALGAPKSMLQYDGTIYVVQSGKTFVARACRVLANAAGEIKLYAGDTDDAITTERWILDAQVGWNEFTTVFSIAAGKRLTSDPSGTGMVDYIEIVGFES